MSAERIHILIAAGGTGGHVYPALAVAEELRAGGYGVAWLGTRDGLEARVVPAAGFKIEFLPVRPLRGGRIRNRLLAPLHLLAALMRAFGFIHRCRARAILGMGGYVSGPAGIAARLAGCRLLVHEQNAVPGLTNRILARLAHRLMEGFPGSFPSSRGAIHTGNPVRGEIVATQSPEQQLADRSGPLRLLVLGGSQGAEALNKAVPAALAGLPTGVSVQVRHQAGTGKLEHTQAAYRERGLKAEVEAYIEDMAGAYDWADLVLCRAGAMTIAELAAAGRGALLVPYPHAVDDHQTANARYLSDAGAAILLPQHEFDGSSLAQLLAELSHARERVLAMAVAACQLACPDARDRVAQLCMEACHA